MFERTGLEESVYAGSMRWGNRLFDQLPRGIRIIQALGMEAVVAANYPEADYTNQAYTVARVSDGLHVVTHRLYKGIGDCHQSSCVAVKLMEGVTEVTLLDGSDIDMAARLRAQNQTYDALQLVVKTGARPDHNPFLGGEARRELEALAERHADPIAVEAML
jgi:hypothetical protein